MLVITDIIAPKSYLLTQEYADSGFFFKAGHLILSTLVKQFTLVLGFTAMECNFIACGQGYVPAKTTKTEDGKEVTTPEEFNAIKSVLAWPIYACTDFAALVNAWNIQIHHWLKYYVMLRLIDRSKPKTQTQVMPQIVCFLVSSIWHGLELGLWVCMFGFGMLLALYNITSRTQLCQGIAKNVPFVIYHPLKWLFFYFCASWIEICFELRYISVFWKVHATMYHVGTWLPILIIIVFSQLPKVRRPRSKNEEQQKTVELQNLNKNSEKSK